MADQEASGEGRTPLEALGDGGGPLEVELGHHDTENRTTTRLPQQHCDRRIEINKSFDEYFSG